ncbi:hypothetical protein DSM25558_0576 [Agrobacterium sp. DSM 25558]|nr:hypothetical protein DSM25558_0576 [Agrobacterium sp. DSM 25558]
MNPEDLSNGGKIFLVACHLDTFTPQQLTFDELGEQFPSAPRWHCSITSAGEN